MAVKHHYFRQQGFPLLLLLPQLIITLIFFLWPAGQAFWQALLREDAFGLSSEFVGLTNFVMLLSEPRYYTTSLTTLGFSLAVSVLALSGGLLLAVLANRITRVAGGFKTLLIWPYAVAPAVAGVLWLFMFNPGVGQVGRWLVSMGIDWDPALNGNHALWLVILASAWKQISYNFLFFLAGLQSIPGSLVEAAAIDGAGPVRRFFSIVFPLLSPTAFFLLVINLVYAFFDTFGVIHATTRGGPGSSTTTLVYQVYTDGFVGLDVGGSAAQSVVLMILVAGLTVVQFKYIEKRVAY